MSHSIILKVQADAQDRNVTLASILSRARTAARRLSLPGVPVWLDKEFGGYEANDDLPDYRWVKAHDEFLNPQHGWCPLNRRRGAVPLHQSVFDLEELLHNSPAGFVTRRTGPVDIEAFGAILTFHSRQRIQNMEIVHALATVRRLLLEWTIALESAGVLGDGNSFTATECMEAYSVTQNFIAHNQSIGVAGNVTGGTNTIAPAQANEGTLDVRKVREFLAEAAGLVGSLPSSVQGDMRDAVNEAQAEAGKASPDAGRLGRTLAVIKDLGVQAGGGVIANGIVAGANALLG